MINTYKTVTYRAFNSSHVMYVFVKIEKRLEKAWPNDKYWRVCSPVPFTVYVNLYCIIRPLHQTADCVCAPFLLLVGTEHINHCETHNHIHRQSSKATNEGFLSQEAQRSVHMADHSRLSFEMEIPSAEVNPFLKHEYCTPWIVIYTRIENMLLWRHLRAVS